MRRVAEARKSGVCAAVLPLPVLPARSPANSIEPRRLHHAVCCPRRSVAPLSSHTVLCRFKSPSLLHSPSPLIAQRRCCVAGECAWQSAHLRRLTASVMSKREGEQVTDEPATKKVCQPQGSERPAAATAAVEPALSVSSNSTSSSPQLRGTPNGNAAAAAAAEPVSKIRFARKILPDTFEVHECFYPRQSREACKKVCL